MIISSNWMNITQQSYLFSADVVHHLWMSLKSSPRNRVHQTYPIWSHPDVAVGIGSELGQVLGHLVGSLEGRSIFFGPASKLGPKKLAPKNNGSKTKPRFLRWGGWVGPDSVDSSQGTQEPLLLGTAHEFVSWFRWMLRWAMKLSSPYNWPTG